MRTRRPRAQDVLERRLQRDRLDDIRGDQKVQSDEKAPRHQPLELIERGVPVGAEAGDDGTDDGSGDAVGTGGTWTWTLRAVAAGESPVRFVYRRTWEDEDPASVFSFTATVDR
jgi:hypothetical protein